MPAKSLTISRVANIAGIGVETIRYYQRIIMRVFLPV